MLRIRVGILVPLVLVGSVAACNEQGTTPTGEDVTMAPEDTPATEGEGETAAPASIEQTVDDYCEDSNEFREAVTADPTNTDLFDVGEPLYMRGTELLQEEIPQSDEDPAQQDELLARTGKCQEKVVSGLADIEA
jgi:hypothetical protein